MYPSAVKLNDIVEYIVNSNDKIRSNKIWGGQDGTLIILVRFMVLLYYLIGSGL